MTVLTWSISVYAVVWGMATAAFYFASKKCCADDDNLFWTSLFLGFVWPAVLCVMAYYLWCKVRDRPSKVG
jgi:hypothetical protein